MNISKHIPSEKQKQSYRGWGKKSETTLELQNRKVELEKLLTQAEASMKQSLAEGNTPKYLGYAKSWFTILENISETQREINKINYENLVINKKK